MYWNSDQVAVVSVKLVIPDNKISYESYFGSKGEIGLINHDWQITKVTIWVRIVT